MPLGKSHWKRAKKLRTMSPFYPKLVTEPLVENPTGNATMSNPYLTESLHAKKTFPTSVNTFEPYETPHGLMEAPRAAYPFTVPYQYQSLPSYSR